MSNHGTLPFPVRLLSRLVGRLCDVPVSAPPKLREDAREGVESLLDADDFAIIAGERVAHSSKNDEMRARAERILEDVRVATERADVAYREWRFQPTLSNALYRDKTRARVSAYDDVAALARYVALTDSSPVVPRGERHG